MHFNVQAWFDAGCVVSLDGDLKDNILHNTDKDVHWEDKGELNEYYNWTGDCDFSTKLKKGKHTINI